MADIPVIPGVKVTTKGILNKPIKDIICAILFGGINNMLKGPLLCITADLNKIADEAGLANLGDLKSAIDDVMADLKAAEKLSGIPETLARVNAAIAEVQSLLALDGLCKIPLKAPKIPDVIAQVIDAEHRELNAIIKDLGRLAKPTMCLSGDGGFGPGGGYNPDSILGSLSKHVGKMGDIPGQQLDALTKRLKGVSKALKASVNRQLFPDFRTKHNLVTGEPVKATDTEVITVNDFKEAAATAQQLVASVNQTGSYPIAADGIQNTNMWLPLLGPEVYAMAVNALSPQDPFFAQQDPIYDYCGKLVGYTSTVVSGDPTDIGGNPVADANPNPPLTNFNFVWMAERNCWGVVGYEGVDTINGRKDTYLLKNPEIELHRGYNHLFSIPSENITGFEYEYYTDVEDGKEKIKTFVENGVKYPVILDSSIAEELFICYVDYVNGELTPRKEQKGTKPNGDPIYQVIPFNNGLSRLETYELLEDANGLFDNVEARKRKAQTLDQFGVPMTSTTLYFAAEQRVYTSETEPTVPSSDVWWYNLQTCVTKKWIPDTVAADGTGTWVEVSEADRNAKWFGSSTNYNDPHVNYLAYSNKDGSSFGLLKFV